MPPGLRRPDEAPRRPPHQPMDVGVKITLIQTAHVNLQISSTNKQLKDIHERSRLQLKIRYYFLGKMDGLFAEVRRAVICFMAFR
jgi:hypothetical protein